MLQDQYDIITAHTSEALAVQVNAMLAQGWTAHGSLAVVIDQHTGKVTFAQAIILRDGAAR